jgi:hypothetical protein
VRPQLPATHISALACIVPARVGVGPGRGSGVSSGPPLFLLVQGAFGSLPPRLNLFRDHPIVWRTFGFAIGVFLFSVTTARVIGDQTKASVIVPATEVVVVLAAIALSRSLQVKAFTTIQLAPNLTAIAGRGRGIIDDLYPGRPPVGCSAAGSLAGSSVSSDLAFVQGLRSSSGRRAARSEADQLNAARPVQLWWSGWRVGRGRPGGMAPRNPGE